MRLSILSRNVFRLWAGVVVLLVALGAAIVWSWPASEPRIQGRTLVEWLQELDADSGPQDPSKAAAVIRSLSPVQMDALAELLERDWGSGPGLGHRLNRLLAPALYRVGVRSTLFAEPGFRNYCDLAMRGVRVLGTSGTPMIPRLSRNLKVWKRSYASACALCTIGGTAVLPVAEMLTSRTNSDLPGHWPFACGLQFAPTADADVVVPAFVRALQDPEVQVQLIATQSLLKFRGREREFVPAIMLNLGSPVIRVRVCSAEVLGWTRSKEAIPRLKSLLSDPDPSVRAAVQRALQDLER